MKIENCKLKIPLLVVFVVLVILPNKANASEFSVAVYPPLIRISATAPANPQTPIVIQNTSEQIETFDILIKPFSASKGKTFQEETLQGYEENGQVIYDNSLENIKDPLMFQRIKIFDGESATSTIELSPKQKKELTLSIDIPENEAESDYYFSILFVSKNPNLNTQIKTNNSRILPGIATNVLLSIGKENPKIQIDDFSTELLKGKGPVEFKIKVSNNGAHFAYVKGQVIIKNVFGQYIGRVDLNPGNVLAGDTRLITSENQIAKALWPERFILGPYKATLSLNYGSGEPVLTRTTHFIGAPIQILVTAIIIVSLMLTIRKRLKHKLNR